MNLTTLTAISPIDGRYRNKVDALAPYFSEFGLIRYRVLIEVEYFIALCEHPLPQLKDFDKSLYPKLRAIYQNFSEIDAKSIKKIEQTTNHDVKAVEYFLKQHFQSLGISAYQEFIHIALTSQDINNTAVPLSIKEAAEKHIIPAISDLIKTLQGHAQQWQDVPMLAHTHGQPASPTRLGKEFMVFVERLEKQLQTLQEVPFAAKFGGATGNFNAHLVAFPDQDWVAFAQKFVEKDLGLSRSKYTTQIEHYDQIAALCDAMKRINTILIDLSRDIWQYISMGYFKQKIKEGEVGSSAMPHKVNPIDFENAEGNLSYANAIFGHLSSKLPISRLQRDLTDSTVLRNIGMPLSHSLLALISLQKGLGKIELNEVRLQQDLNNNWAILAEAIQTVLRREGYPKPYEALKELTRTQDQITSETIHTFVRGLDIDEDVKKALLELTPSTYVGVKM